jgi:hypothetical protein
VEGRRFTIVTDHSPNTFFETKTLLNRRQARWAEFLQDFDCEWEFRPGRVNVADPLSRVPGPTPVLVLAALRRAHECSLNPSDSAARPAMLESFTPLVSRIVAGYQQDAWFGDPTNTASLQQESGLWYKDQSIVVPDVPALKQEIITGLHSSVWAGHFGVKKTKDAVSRAFWWPKLGADVAKFCSHCDTCQRNKPSNTVPVGPLRPLPIPERPWESIGIDYVVQLPTSTAGFDAVCTVVDHLTKMVHLIPCSSNIGAVGTADLFVQHIFRLHGMPRNVISDRGSVFTSNFFAALCQRLGMRQLMSTAYHPQTDGLTERYNRVMEDTLRHFISPTQDDWHHLLPCVEFAINNSKQVSTAFSPFYLNYGYHPHIPLALQLPKRGRALPEGRATPAAQRFTAAMQQALQLARSNLQAAQQRQKAYADQRRGPVTVSEGDMILLSSKNINLKHPGTRKLLPKWLGPFKVIKQVNPVAFKLELPPSMSKLHPVFHASLLKPYKPDGPVQPPPVVLEDGDVLFEVEQLLDVRVRKQGRKRVQEYLIKWAGYGHENNTWEPAINIADPDLITAFEQAQQARQEAAVQRPGGGRRAVQAKRSAR